MKIVIITSVKSRQIFWRLGVVAAVGSVCNIVLCSRRWLWRCLVCHPRSARIVCVGRTAPATLLDVIIYHWVGTKATLGCDVTLYHHDPSPRRQGRILISDKPACARRMILDPARTRALARTHTAECAELVIRVFCLRLADDTSVKNK